MRCGWLNPPIGNIMCVRCGTNDLYRELGVHKLDNDPDDKSPPPPKWQGPPGGMPGPYYTGRMYRRPWE
jgi:hypothetical protein